ncbi:EVE domain-containing protein [Shewanella inventionis]|uniref:EVE domain-containing protein n=1 Tax=Shewanella inventionis TaxID=1738770 RepID=UPI001CBF9617|nr:EVE domain-containing protein [Shewanella inventionis]UAL41520.1 EVE domain-containing protein [Shewanella inventionis]
MKYWLMKSEPDDISIGDLRDSPNHTMAWQGIRNYQARNFIRDEITHGDQVLFYHSSCKVPGVVGIATVVSQPTLDESAFDPQSRYFDPKSEPDKPRWWQVDIQFTAKLNQIVSLQQLKSDPALQDMVLVTKGARLSVQPVSADEFAHIVMLGQ